MNEPSIHEDIAYLTESLVSPVENRIMLRASLESALFRMGYTEAEIDDALNSYYSGMRTLQ